MRTKGSKVALTVWVEAEIRAAVEDYAVKNNTFLSEVATMALTKFFEGGEHEIGRLDSKRDSE